MIEKDSWKVIDNSAVENISLKLFWEEKKPAGFADELEEVQLLAIEENYDFQVKVN